MAGVLALVGGGLIVVGALVLWRTATALNPVLGLPAPWYLAGAAAGLLSGLLGGATLVAARHRRSLGAGLLACAAASLPLAYGGLVVGFLLVAIAGGIAAAAPPRPVPGVPPGTSAGPSPPWT